LTCEDLLRRAVIRLKRARLHYGHGTAYPMDDAVALLAHEIRDVESMLALLSDLGAEVAWTGPNAVTVDTRNAVPKPLDPGLCARIRASILLAAPLLARFRKVVLPPPGGDVIGRRRVDTHFLALEALGATVLLGDRYEIETEGLQGADIFLDEPSVTGTENALMAAVAATGRTILRNAAAEPHVQDLARCLVAMGARIEGIGTNQYTVEGGHQLHGCRFEIGPDHIEIGSFLGLAAVTNGVITIDPVRPDELRSILYGFDRLGIRPQVDGTKLVVQRNQERRVRSDLGGHIPKLEDGPWPAFHDRPSLLVELDRRRVVHIRELAEVERGFMAKLVSKAR
jgi:UDP-N-acetylglucosamine 1-carboxyvinyltransferase